MGFYSNLAINITSAECAHGAVMDGLTKEGWEEEEGLAAEDDKLFSFVATLTHEEFNGWLKLTYNIDETVLICICVELESTEYIDAVKKGFPNDDDDMEPEEMIRAAIKAVKLGLDLLSSKKYN